MKKAKVYDARRLQRVPQEVVAGCPSGALKPTAAYRDKRPGDGWVVMIWDQLAVAPSSAGTPWEGIVRVSVKHNSGDSVDAFRDRANALPVTWDDLQAIKSRFWPNRIAIEVYPPIDQLVNDADMRWLWVLPVTAALPFNLHGKTDVLTGKD